MKFTTTVTLASLAATGLAAPRTQHARFHNAKREIEISKRAWAADPSLAKRCGETVNAGQWGTFKNCWEPECASNPACGSGSSPAAAPADSSPAPAAAPAASTPAPAVNNQVADNDNNSNNAKGQAAAHSTPAAAASSPASTPASSSSSGSSSDSSGKVGLAYNDPSLITGQWLSGDASWAYNWGFQPGKLNSKLGFVPMFHDKSQLSNFQNADLSAYSHLLSLNEPDEPASAGGSDLSAADACSAHKAAFKNLSGKQISSPAVSSTQNTPGKGLDWLSDFKKACPDAQVDFVPLHWYGWQGASGQDQGAAFLKYVESAKSTVQGLYPNAPIWFTEFAAIPITDAQVNADFLDAVMPTLKSDSSIGRIAPFMVGNGGALGSSTPNAAGKVLISI